MTLTAIESEPSGMSQRPRAVTYLGRMRSPKVSGQPHIIVFSALHFHKRSSLIADFQTWRKILVSVLGNFCRADLEESCSSNIVINPALSPTQTFPGHLDKLRQTHRLLLLLLSTKLLSNKKHRHRRNVTSHHSLSFSSQDNFHH